MKNFAQGATVQIGATFKDVSGALIDPVTVTFTVRSEADGDENTYIYGIGADIIRSSLGVYYFDQDTAAMSGVWSWRIVGSGATSSTTQGSFYVEPTNMGGDIPAPTGYILPAYAYANLPTPTTTNAGLFTRVTDYIRGIWYSAGSQWISLTGYTANVQEFGAIPDCTNGTNGTDNLAAVTAAIAALKTAGGGNLLFPASPTGGYRIGGILDFTNCRGINVKGTYASYDDDGVNSHQPSTIFFNSAAHYFKIVKGRALNLKNITIDCNNVASANGIVADRLIQFIWENVSVVKCQTGTAYKFYDSTGADIVAYGVLINCGTEVSGTALHLTGTATSGCYHLNFENFRGGYNGAQGILLENCDNCKFFGGNLYRESGSGYSVYWKDNGLNNYPNSISFWHFEPGDGAVHKDAAITNPGVLFQWDQSNGTGSMPDSTFLTNNSMSVTADGAGSIGWRVARWLLRGAITRAGWTNSFGSMTQDDDGIGMCLFSSSSANAASVRLVDSDKSLHIGMATDATAAALVDSLVLNKDYLIAHGGVVFGTLDGDAVGTNLCRHFSDSGNPSDLLGSNGDFYDKKDGTAAAKDLKWHKEVGVWVHIVP